MAANDTLLLEKINKLKVYAEKLKQNIQGSTGEKRAFFERDLKKTLDKIVKLQ